VANQEDNPLVPWSAEDVARLRGNLRRTRMVIVLILLGVAAELRLAQGVGVVVILVYLVVMIPASLWYVTRFFNQMIATGNG
jgi:hypothetical protein